MRSIVFIAAMLIMSSASAQITVIDERPALDPGDKQLFTEALNRAMVRETGSVSEWSDPASQNHGQVLAGGDYTMPILRSYRLRWRASMVIQRHRLQGGGWYLARGRLAVERPICSKCRK